MQHGLAALYLKLLYVLNLQRTQKSRNGQITGLSSSVDSCTWPSRSTRLQSSPSPATCIFASKEFELKGEKRFWKGCEACKNVQSMSTRSKNDWSSNTSSESCCDRCSDFCSFNAIPMASKATKWQSISRKRASFEQGKAGAPLLKCTWMAHLPNRKKLNVFGWFFKPKSFYKTKAPWRPCGHKCRWQSPSLLPAQRCQAQSLA